ncbi:MAG: hydrogenase nickel incorporation protein HypB [Bacteroidales bacterium]
MCTTCGCDQPDNTTRYTIPGEDHAHEHDHNHDHDHDHNHDHSHKNEKHEHTHSHTHSHGHKHPHGHEHGESVKGAHEHEHTHAHSHPHEHEHDHNNSRVVQLEQDVLAQNNLLAERNRGYFEAKNIFSLNFVSSPGSGKTTILERTINDLKKETSFFVIEGDQQTLNDADRINATGAPVIQINTGNGCHLDAEMINKAVKQIEVKENSVLIIENVGNLVCPAMFDLGESKRVVVISVTEGEDKPLKYPGMFNSADICIINKIDLLPYVDFNIDKVKEYALQVNHHLEFFELSAKTGEGMNEWYEWLKSKTEKS